MFKSPGPRIVDNRIVETIEHGELGLRMATARRVSDRGSIQDRMVVSNA